MGLTRLGEVRLLAADGPAPFIGLALCAVAVVLVFFWYRAIRRKRLIEDVPTSKVKGVAIGLTEVKGRARRREPLTSYLAHQPTVWYRYNISEHWRRTVTETYTDSEGKRKTRTKTESGWSTVQSDEAIGRFFLEDETGLLRIDPRGAELEGRTIFDRTCSRSDPLYYGKGPRRAVSDSTGRRHFTETAIVIQDPLYVMGTARVRHDAVAAEIAHDDDSPMFIISTRSEAQITSGYGVGSTLFGVFGVLFAAAGPGLLVAASQAAGPESPAVIGSAVAGGLGYVLLLSLLYAMLLYNGLVRVRERIGKAWALIEVQLRRRSDLIPPLAAAVKGYADHERAVQQGLSQLRAEGLAGRARTPKGKQIQQAQHVADGQTALLTQVLGVVEAYPELKADALYRDLQAQLADAEDRIALARAFYNDTVTAYNERIATMPDVLFARLMKLGRVGHYTIQAFERRPIEVRLHTEPDELTPSDTRDERPDASA